MKQKVLFFAVLLMALTVQQRVHAYDFSTVVPSGQTLYFNIIGGEAQVTSEFGNSPYYSNYPTGALTIPSSVTHNGTSYAVTSVGYGAFTDCSGLTSVSIPISVTSIGMQAFDHCTGLSSMTIPNSVASIGSGAFVGCTGLTSITLPDSLLQIEGHVFGGCTNLTSITIPNSVNNIGDYAFSGSGLTSITIPNSVTSIGQRAFADCISLVNLTLSESINSIGTEAFNNCTRLALSPVNYTGTIAQWCGIYFASESANPLSFSRGLNVGGSHITNLVIPDGVVEIKQYSFSHCDITSVIIPNSVVSIKAGAFHRCDGLISVIIPDSTTYIGDRAFESCSGLTSVTIGSSVMSIGENAFSSYGLSSIYYNGTISQWCGINFFGVYAAFTEYPYDFYINGSLVENLIIPEGVTTINNYVFHNCTSLRSVTLPSSLNNIGYRTFFNCNHITTIKSLAMLPPALGSFTFYGLPSNVEVHIPCESMSAYSTLWGGTFSNFIEDSEYDFDVTSADETMGHVVVDVQPTCNSDLATFRAVAASGYQFDHWSDGDTVNPRTITLTGDTTIVAYFAQYVGVDGVEMNNINIYSCGGKIIVDNVQSEAVSVYDMMGCMVNGGNKHQFDVPASGVYMVKIGDRPARRIVVIR